MRLKDGTVKRLLQQESYGKSLSQPKRIVLESISFDQDD